MLTRGASDWYQPVTPNEVTPFFHTYLMEKPYRRDTDLSDKQGQSLREYDEGKVAKLIATMPMTKWSGSSKSLFVFEGGVFGTQIKIEEQHEVILFGWVRNICEYRLHWYFEKKTPIR